MLPVIDKVVLKLKYNTIQYNEYFLERRDVYARWVQRRNLFNEATRNVFISRTVFKISSAILQIVQLRLKFCKFYIIV